MSAQAANISSEAAYATKLLDKAVSYIGEVRKTYKNNLNDIRSLLQSVKYQDALQTPTVGLALSTVKDVLERLVQVSKSPRDLNHQLSKIMDELNQATVNLRSQLPGDISTASDNNAKSGIQTNAAIGGNSPEGRVGTTASRNTATNRFMLGLEIIGAASAASALLETAISIIKRVRKAHEQQKNLAKVLRSHYDELISTRKTIQIVEDEDALRTAAVVSELVKLEDVAARLVDCLEKMVPGTKGSMRQLAHQLVQGSRDENALADIMNKLSRANSSLSLHIQVANVGLMRTIRDNFVANAEVVNRIDLVLQQVFGEGRGLKLAELLRYRSARDDGMVPLSDGDIAWLTDEVAFLTGDADTASKPAANGLTSRIVIDNSTEEQALQINGPIGEKGWWEVSHLEIRRNKAIGRSIQVNHSMSMDAFERLLAVRAADSRG
ncbi:MAG: hypothetical protein Q9187_003984 [Circinaria calcarea]